MDRTCVVCNNLAPFRLRKGTTDYFMCESCGHLFSDYIQQDGMVGGEYYQERNHNENHIRIGRIAKMMDGLDKKDYYILDFGAGFGALMQAFRAEGYNCDAYDAFNEEFSRLPTKNKYHAVTMIETLEHTCSPYLELDVINRSMVLGGGVMIETSFVDVAALDSVPIEDFFYIAPQNGHSSIFSWHSLDILMINKGFQPRRHWNRNVRNFVKVRDLK